MSDDGWVDDEYFVRPEFREQPKQKPTDDESDPRTLDQKRKRLDAIIADSTLSTSDRQDARRILQLAEVRPQEFNRDFAELQSRLGKKDQ